MNYPTFSAFVRLRPGEAGDDELRSDTVTLEEVVALAAAPLPPRLTVVEDIAAFEPITREDVERHENDKMMLTLIHRGD